MPCLRILGEDATYDDVVERLATDYAWIGRYTSRNLSRRTESDEHKGDSGEHGMRKRGVSGRVVHSVFYKGHMEDYSACHGQ